MDVLHVLYNYHHYSYYESQSHAVYSYVVLIIIILIITMKMKSGCHVYMSQNLYGMKLSDNHNEQVMPL